MEFDVDYERVNRDVDEMYELMHKEDKPYAFSIKRFLENRVDYYMCLATAWEREALRAQSEIRCLRERLVYERNRANLLGRNADQKEITTERMFSDLEDFGIFSE